MRCDIFLILIVLFSAGCERHESAPVEGQRLYLLVDFPELRPVCVLPRSLSWSFQDGPDFYVYRAADPRRPSLGLGIYFGNFPSLHRPELANSLPGIVAGAAIEWHAGEEVQSSRVQFFRETVFVYPPHKFLLETAEAQGVQLSGVLRIHVWAYADSESDMSELTRALEGLIFLQLTTRGGHDANV